jgi:hypothetical protein
MTVWSGLTSIVIYTVFIVKTLLPALAAQILIDHIECFLVLVFTNNTITNAKVPTFLCYFGNITYLALFGIPNQGSMSDRWYLIKVDRDSTKKDPIRHKT